jgi:1-acyl-sn-glycerol-3-phosphate acyltransferase
MRRRVIFAARIVRYFLTFAASLQIFVRAEVIDRDNVPPGGPVIIAANHRSIFDPIALFGALKKRRNVAFMAAAGLFKVPVLGSILRWFGAIPVARGTDAAIQASDTGITLLRVGAAVAAFIEGRISKTGELLEPKKGVAYMAFATGAPVVPAAIVGTERVKRPGTPLWRWSFTKRYVIVFGPKIAVPELDHEPDASDRSAYTALVMAEIAALVTDAERHLVSAAQ